ncbi:glutathione S-transferase family protein [Bordetella sp. LUAb4]|uniref:glutathione S-transferase family protein n=1 Tax=Bordetella sp. LUAb4 TaxID=2843195 RepID=UPI001E28440B|nr:glutathione S-transferase N-terminal domain-containing protein [Bordetella sp. LUAb4]
MIQLYFWTTPNAYKVSILLEELGLAYSVVPVHIGKGEQFGASFLEISPNNKIPALIDDDGPLGQRIALFESGAIMIYLAEKVGSQLYPADPSKRYAVLQWLMFQMSAVGPMLGQAHHFRKYAPARIEYAVERYTNEATRLYRVMDTQLGRSPYLAGEDYSLADIATYPWLRAYRLQGQNLADWPNLQRWYSTMRARAAVQRGLAVMAEKVDRNDQAPSGDRWQNLFGQNQFASHKN